MSLKDAYVRAALACRHQRPGNYVLAVPLGGQRDAWSFMRFVARNSVRVPDSLSGGAP